LAIFSGTWANNDANAVLSTLTIIPKDDFHSDTSGQFLDPPNQVLAEATWDGQAKALTVFLVTKELSQNKCINISSE
jgi:hypothetical protein